MQKLRRKLNITWKDKVLNKAVRCKRGNSILPWTKRGAIVNMRNNAFEKHIGYEHGGNGGGGGGGEEEEEEEEEEEGEEEEEEEEEEERHWS